MFDDEMQRKQDEYQHTYSTAAEYRKHDENWPDFAFRGSTFTTNKPDLTKPIKNMPASEEKEILFDLEKKKRSLSFGHLGCSPILITVMQKIIYLNYIFKEACFCHEIKIKKVTTTFYFTILNSYLTVLSF